MSRLQAEVLTHVHSLRSYARLLCRNASDADDLVQETLEPAICGADRFMSGRDLRAWLFSILRNAFVSSGRAARSRRNRETDWARERPAAGPGGQESRAELTRLLDAIDRLPEPQRQVLLLVAIEGLSTDEAAAALDQPVGTVRSRLARAREALRDRYLEDGPSPALKLVGGRHVRSD